MNEARALLRHLARGPCSGGALAQELGLTRGGVWKRVQALRAAGLPIVADRRTGYALARPVDLLDADAIRARLPATAPIPEVAWAIDSTQAELLRRGSTQALPAVLLAETQTQGRGRRGRVWQSPLAAHLYVSLALRLELPLPRVAGLSLAVGVSLAESLSALGYTGVRLKWPNDLWVDGRKLGGILVDVSGEMSGPVMAVIGIGINVRMPDGFAARIDQPWCDLDGIGPPIARNVLAATVIGGLLQVLERFPDQGMREVLAQWPRWDALRGCRVDVDDGRTRIAAQALGLADDGGLRVRDDHGERVVHAGEVSLRRVSP